MRFKAIGHDSVRDAVQGHRLRLGSRFKATGHDSVTTRFAMRFKVTTRFGATLSTMSYVTLDSSITGGYVQVQDDAVQARTVRFKAIGQDSSYVTLDSSITGGYVRCGSRFQTVRFKPDGAVQARRCGSSQTVRFKPDGAVQVIGDDSIRLDAFTMSAWQGALRILHPPSELGRDADD
ncbi:hypothetical protein HDU86_002428 [Geranomyces michiganensis]|nr:hypothetical protein HDU86_002428 [Geranomyces michiganensis]